MAFEGLTDKLQNAFRKLSSKGKLTEADVKTAMREVRMALLEADVNFVVVKDFVKKVTERAVGADILASLTPGQQVINCQFAPDCRRELCPGAFLQKRHGADRLL